MTKPKPPLPSPKLEPTPITSDQYCEYTPEKLELWSGFYEYGGQDFMPFYLAILTNMGIKKAVEYIPLSLLPEAIAAVLQKHQKLQGDDETSKAMLNHLNRGLADLQAVADYLESE